MMKKALLRIGTAAALVALTATSAHAIPFPYTNPNVCGGDKFETCASLSISWSGTTATITIQNLTTNGDIFTAFGFTHLPAGTTITASDAGTLASRFTAGDANDIQAIGFTANSPSPQNGLTVADGGPFTFTITFGGTFTGSADQLNALDFSIHGQVGPNGCSTKLIIAPDGSVAAGPYDPNCVTTVVPEPITMTLLATGLAGMGGAGALRRRRKVS